MTIQDIKTNGQPFVNNFLYSVAFGAAVLQAGYGGNNFFVLNASKIVIESMAVVVEPYFTLNTNYIGANWMVTYELLQLSNYKFTRVFWSDDSVIPANSNPARFNFSLTDGTPFIEQYLNFYIEPSGGAQLHFIDGGNVSVPVALGADAQFDIRIKTSGYYLP